MHTLHITVAGKVATYSARDGSIICGNDDYQVQFALDSGWDGLKAKARFRWNGKHKDVPIVDGLAAVPRITNAHEVKVGVYSEDGSLKTTTAARVPCNKSILCGDSAPTEGNEAHYASEAQKAADRAEAAAKRAEAAGGSGGGTGGGVVVDPESVNQAQEAAQAAQESAEAAADSAQAAGQSAEEAETSKSQATAAQEAAEAAQRAAEAAESGAAQKATDAEDAAQTAASKATEANQAKEAAETAKSRAESARDTAVANAEAASTSATVAAGEAGNASKSAAAAATDRTATETSKNQATAAKEAAETAQAAAQSASTEASQKATEANEAKEAAQSAKGEAQTAATNAGKSATAAAGSATTASNAATAAQTAQGKAETAQAAAESAKSTATQKATDATNAAQTATSKATEASQSATAAGTAKTAAQEAAARAEEAANRLLGVAVVGVIDKHGNLVLTGLLEDGTYTAYYEVQNDDGTTSLVKIGDLTHGSVTPDPVTYTVTFVADGATVSAETYTVENPVVEEPAVPAKDGYTGVWETYDLTKGGNITVNAVYTAIETEEPEPVTENITLTKDVSIVTDTGADRANTTAYCATPHIDVSDIPKPCTIHLTGARWTYTNASDNGYIRFYIANTSGTKLASDYTHPSKMPSGVTLATNGSDETDVTVTITSDNIGTVRFTGWYTYGNLGNTNASMAQTKATLTYTPAS